MDLKRKFFPLLVFFVFPFTFSQQPGISIDDFETVKKWKIIASDLVEVSTSTTDGVAGTCLKLDYHFVGGSGYGGIQTQFPLLLPSNYEFSFFLKANSPNNNLEFKLLDKEGTSVWWTIYRDFTFPKNWVKIKIKQRHISKAWGPAAEPKPIAIDKIEFMLSSVTGGKGTVFLDNFTFTPLDSLQENNFTPELISPTANLSQAKNLFDTNLKTEYTLASDEASMIIDLHRLHEFGGIKIDWSKQQFAKEFSVLLSENKSDWQTVYTVSNGKNSGASFIPLPEAEARYIKLSFNKTGAEHTISIKEIKFLSLDFSSSPNNMYKEIAKEKPRGYYPKYLLNEASYFTIVGVNGDRNEALINEEGQIEVDKSSFSLEPFITNGKELVTWNESSSLQTLEDDYLPIPIVKRSNSNVELTIKTFAEGEPQNSCLYVTYKLKNISKKKQTGGIYFALRPFQVNPSYQFLNTQGGVAKIESISFDGKTTLINDTKSLFPLQQPDAFGAVAFDQGDIVEYIAMNNFPKQTAITDVHGFASAAFQYHYNLAPGKEIEFDFVSPFHATNPDLPSFTTKIEKERYIEAKFTQVKNFWKKKLNVIDIKLPPKYQKWINTLRSNLAYILINRDSVGIQPGSRSYDRSWIRDGALTSSALLKLGNADEVKEFINWYASFQYENGKIPCVVDRRGADPVPENDSHGEFIYLVNQYYLFTKDTLFLRSKFKQVANAATYLAFLINQRLTDSYKTVDSLKEFYGLLPESISHEGYSEKPMHSYWDDFFALRGLKDAVEISSVLGEKEYEKKFSLLRDEFSKNLYASITLVQKKKNISYIPGCAELGDFDATSTSISLYPCNEKNNLPKPSLQHTFDKYFDFFTKRRDNTSYHWINYTPYELRTVGSFILLNQPERAHALLDFFFKDQRPKGWNHWAEVVWSDPKAARFIGDMPHTWVGSDYISSLRSFFVYEDEARKSLVLGAGILPDWIASQDGVSCNNLITYYGTISYAIKQHEDKSVTITVNGKLEIPEGNILFKLPGQKQPKQIMVNGTEEKLTGEEEITIPKLPAAIKIVY